MILPSIFFFKKPHPLHAQRLRLKKKGKRTNTPTHIFSLAVGLHHDQGSVAPSLLPKERSARVHSYITQPMTKREEKWEGKYSVREREKWREVILVYGGLYPSKQPCLPLPAIVDVS